jgi:hypothetical protein
MCGCGGAKNPTAGMTAEALVAAAERERQEREAQAVVNQSSSQAALANAGVR